MIEFAQGCHRDAQDYNCRNRNSIEAIRHRQRPREYARGKSYVCPRAIDLEQVVAVVVTIFVLGSVHVDFHTAFDFADNRFRPSHGGLLH